jgi:hypothetical protein
VDESRTAIAGGLCYEYHVVKALSGGSLITGEREIEPAEAAIVERIFREFIAGVSPKQYRGDDPKLRAADTARMVNNASELAARLSALRSANMVVERTILDDEGHLSVVPASLSRALRFALPPK